jgi:hypothetical protein
MPFPKALKDWAKAFVALQVAGAPAKSLLAEPRAYFA